jgi:hypothetical protein
MKKIVYFISFLLLLVSCSESLEDRAAREAQDITRKMCPTPYINNERTDSCAFNQETKTYTYYKKLKDQADNKEFIHKNYKKLCNTLVKSIRENTKIDPYKKKEFNFRYVYRSAKDNEILLDKTITPKEY